MASLKVQDKLLSKKSTLGDFAWPWRQPVPEFEWILAGHHDARDGYSCLRDKPARSWGLFYTRRGRGYFRSKGHVVAAIPHRLVLVEPKEPHDYGKDPSSPALELIWLHFHPRPEWLRFLDWPKAAPGIRTLDLIHSTDQKAATRLLRNVVGYAKRETFADGLEAMHGLEEFVLFCHECFPQHEFSSLDTRIEDLTIWLRQNLRTDPSIADMARKAGMSVSHFAHSFRKQTGQSPKEFLGRLKIQEAKHLLEDTTLHIARVAEQSGFLNPYHFSKRFRQVTGRTPSDYRRINKPEIVGKSGPGGDYEYEPSSGNPIR